VAVLAIAGAYLRRRLLQADFRSGGGLPAWRSALVPFADAKGNAVINAGSEYRGLLAQAP
jgi:hypothetical protein